MSGLKSTHAGDSDPEGGPGYQEWLGTVEQVDDREDCDAQDALVRVPGQPGVQTVRVPAHRRMEPGLRESGAGETVRLSSRKLKGRTRQSQAEVAEVVSAPALRELIITIKRPAFWVPDKWHPGYSGRFVKAFASVGAGDTPDASVAIFVAGDSWGIPLAAGGAGAGVEMDAPFGPDSGIYADVSDPGTVEGSIVVSAWFEGQPPSV